MDVYRIGTLLEGLRELAAALAADGKRVRICVQGSMGVGAFTAMPLALAGVRRILDAMDWGEGEPGTFVRLGGVSAADVADDDDILIIIAPQNITGFSVLPALSALCEAAGPGRAVLLLNPRLVDIPSSNNVMQVRGREERLAFAAGFEEVHHFRLIYNKPYHFPIYGALRYAYGGPWELYKRLGRMETEVYRFAQAFQAEPSRGEITEGIARDIGRVADPVYEQ
jgi:adenylate kinase